MSLSSLWSDIKRGGRNRAASYIQNSTGARWQSYSGAVVKSDILISVKFHLTVFCLVEQLIAMVEGGKYPVFCSQSMLAFCCF